MIRTSVSPRIRRGHKGNSGQREEQEETGKPGLAAWTGRNRNDDARGKGHETDDSYRQALPNRGSVVSCRVAVGDADKNREYRQMKKQVGPTLVHSREK